MSSSHARTVEQKNAKSEAILKSAKALLVESHGVLPNVKAIADHAGIAKGSVYSYFESKELLFMALYQRLWAKCVESFERVELTKKYEWQSAVNITPVLNFWYENKTFSRLMALKDANLMFNLSAEDNLRFEQLSRDTLTKKAKLMSAMTAQQTETINEWAELIELTINLIQIVWLKESKYNTQLPVFSDLLSKVEKVLKPHWELQISQLNKASKKKKVWRSFLRSAK